MSSLSGKLSTGASQIKHSSVSAGRFKKKKMILVLEVRLAETSPSEVTEEFR